MREITFRGRVMDDFEELNIKKGDFVLEFSP